MSNEDRRPARKYPKTGIWTDIPKIECQLWTPEPKKGPQLEKIECKVKVEGFKVLS